MTINQDRIITEKARDYVESEGKNLSDYMMRGVHYQGDFKGFVEAVPENAEIVVKYQFTNSFWGTHRGTALIPRGNLEEAVDESPEGGTD